MRPAMISRLRFILADAENTMEPDGAYEAIVCRHLVWTLTDPSTAFAEWRRLLEPGGFLCIFDGNWAEPSGIVDRSAPLAIRLLDRVFGADGTSHSGLPERHDAIMAALPFGAGLTPARLEAALADAGFAIDSIGISAKSRRRSAIRPASGIGCERSLTHVLRVAARAC